MKQHRFAYGWMMYLAACGGGGAALGEGVSGGREFPDSGLGVDSAGETGGETGATAETSVAVETAGLDTAGDDTGTPAETGGSETAVVLPDYVDISASDMTIVGDMLPARSGMQQVYGAGDLDGDGSDDLIWFNMPPPFNSADDLGMEPSQQFGVVLETSPGLHSQSAADGLWDASESQGFSYGSGFVKPLGDYNGDGYDDVLVQGVDRRPMAWILPGPATGRGMLAEVSLASLFLTPYSFPPPHIYWDSAGMYSIGVIEDLSGDGVPGLFIRGKEEVALVDGLPGEPASIDSVRWARIAVPAEPRDAWPWSPALAADWNGDGASDISVDFAGSELDPAAEGSVLATVLGPFAPGSTTPVVESPHSVLGMGWAYHYPGDFDGDGLVELVTDSGGGSIDIHEMDQPFRLGEASPMARIVEDSSEYLRPLLASPSWGDFDGDGNLDLALHDYVSPCIEPSCLRSMLLYGPLQGSMSTESAPSTRFGATRYLDYPSPFIAVLGDTNADGLTDLAYTVDTLTTDFISTGGWYSSGVGYHVAYSEGSELNVFFGRSDRFR